MKELKSFGFKFFMYCAIILLFVIAFAPTQGCKAIQVKPALVNLDKMAEEMNAIKAENIQLAKNLKLVEAKNIELSNKIEATIKADAQIAGNAGVNNKIMKTLNEMRIGSIGGSFNDTGLLKMYIKYLSWVCGVLILSGFILMLLGIIEHIIIIIYLLKSDRLNDARRNGILKKEA